MGPLAMFHGPLGTPETTLRTTELELYSKVLTLETPSINVTLTSPSSKPECFKISVLFAVDYA